MKTLHISIILIIVVVSVSCFVLSDVHAQDCMGGQYCGGNMPPSTSAENRNMVVSLNFYSNSTIPHDVHYLWLRFFDAKNDTLIKNVSFFINATKDDKVLMHELFYTKTGLMLMKFYPTHDTEKLIVNGTRDPVLGGMMSENDTLPITTSVFAENGMYHIHLEALALVNGNELVDQNNPPTFDSWWSVDDKGGISKYDNSTISFGSTTPPVKIKDESPLQQFKSGVTTQNIVCKDGFVLAIKKHGHQPACVNPDAIPKLVLRGWSENPLDSLLLKYGNQTQANLVFHDIMNEQKIREWSMKGWRYSDYSYASNGETFQSSATIHLYLPSNIGQHECENGSYGIVVINLKPVEIEHNYTDVGCNIVTTTSSVDPESNG